MSPAHKQIYVNTTWIESLDLLPKLSKALVGAEKGLLDLQERAPKGFWFKLNLFFNRYLFVIGGEAGEFLGESNRLKERINLLASLHFRVITAQICLALSIGADYNRFKVTEPQLFEILNLTNNK